MQPIYVIERLDESGEWVPVPWRERWNHDSANISKSEMEKNDPESQFRITPYYPQED